MHRPRILIVHATKYGQTQKIAERIAAVCERHEFETTLVRAEEAELSQDLARYAGVILGAPVFLGSHPRPLRRYVERHRFALDHMPSAFYSVSGSAASVELSAQADALRFLDEFLAVTHWHPTRTASFAGAINFTRYGWFMRWFMKRIAGQAGVSTDTSRDHEFTDWNAVERFATEFANLVAPLTDLASRTPEHNLVFIK